MNVKEYIESGILEAYVLGALTDSEQAEVAANIAQYPELAAEVTAIEGAMQNLASDGAKEPPAFMKDNIWDALNETEEEEPVEEAPPVREQKQIPLPPEPAKPSWTRAAIWAAVLVSVVTNFLLLSQRNESREQQDVLAARLDSISAQQEQLVATLNTYKKEKDMLADPAMQTIIMRNEADATPAGMVYWSKEKGDAYLALHKLPMPPQGKQYQLWVIQNGTPVSMGVIANDLVQKEGMMMKIAANIKGGQAFAISIEKEGGNPTPTQVYMVGAI